MRGAAGPPQATCNAGNWTVRGSCETVPVNTAPDVTYVTAQMFMAFGLNGSCSSRATDLHSNGLAVELQQVAATLLNATAVVTTGGCSTNRRRVSTVDTLAGEI
jgi:hypothetical protein